MLPVGNVGLGAGSIAGIDSQDPSLGIINQRAARQEAPPPPPPPPPPIDYVEPQVDVFRDHGEPLFGLFGIPVVGSRDGVEDASVHAAVDGANSKFRSFGGAITAKVDQNDILSVARAAADYGQVTAQEWGQIDKFVHDHPGRLTDQAQRMFETLDVAVQNRGAANAPGFNPVTGVVLRGDELNNLLASLENLARG